MYRLAKAFALLIALGTLPMLLSAADPPKGGTKDQDRMQGTWKIAEITVDGKEVDVAAVAKVRYVFSGPASEYKSDTEHVKGTYKLDVTVSPRGIDMLNGENKVMSRGVYKFDGDELIWCYVRSTDGDRPAGFASKPGSKAILLRLKKVAEKKDDKKNPK
jgi:uncharacterized protein (TIGR03067 family)